MRSFRSAFSGYSKSRSLGHIVSAVGSIMDPSKVEAYTIMAETTTGRSLRKFSGACWLLPTFLLMGFFPIRFNSDPADEKGVEKLFVEGMSVKESFEELITEIAFEMVELCVRGSGGYWASMRIESNLMYRSFVVVTSGESSDEDGLEIKRVMIRDLRDLFKAL
ncbi:hypothetical protein Tco_0201818 [Tanacetum coccineum]